ncbi:iron-containing alcohol dehydrogenase, partial [Enorma sp.]|uniref:iron-containing alcohol dehydrogenase n=1 Tax=Enorma sp. TaxID=1920692 RepID=UPI003AB61140
KSIGLYDCITQVLKEGNMPFVEISGIQPNPRRSLVEKGVALALEERADFVLAVGGASTIDTGKAIALGIANDGDFWQFFSWNPLRIMPQRKVPVGAIPTIAAAGSETSFSIVILDDIDLRKKFNSNFTINRPEFAVMNPVFTFTVPRYQTAVGAVDTFSHTFDRYFNKTFCALGDRFAVSLMRNVVEYGQRALTEPNSYEARSELLMCASMGHNGITGIGKSGPGGAVHSLEAQISGTYDTPHGAGIGVMMHAYLEYLATKGEPIHVARAAQFAVDVFDAEPDMNDVQGTALEGVRRLRAWIKSMGLPLTLKELGVPDPVGDFEDIVARRRCSPDGIIYGFIDLDEAASREIYASVLE